MYSGKVDRTKEQQLQRLCAKVTSTVDLAGARVKVVSLTCTHVFCMCEVVSSSHQLLVSVVSCMTPADADRQ